MKILILIMKVMIIMCNDINSNVLIILMIILLIIIMILM